MEKIIRIRCAKSNIELVFDCSRNKQALSKFIYDNKHSVFYFVSAKIDGVEYGYGTVSEQPKIVQYGSNDNGYISMLSFDRSLSCTEESTIVELNDLNIGSLSKPKAYDWSFDKFKESCGLGSGFSRLTAVEIDEKPTKAQRRKANEEGLKSAMEYLRYAKDNIEMVEYHLEKIDFHF